MSERARELDEMMSRYRVGAGAEAVTAMGGGTGHEEAEVALDQNEYDNPARMSA